MITCKKCDCCAHELVCAMKQAYRQGCERISNSEYTNAEGYDVSVKDSSFISVSVECKYMSPIKQQTRGMNNE